GQQQADMQRRRAVDDGDGVCRAGDLRHLLLEARDEAADGGDEGGVEAFLEVTPLIAAEAWLMQRRCVDIGGQRLAQRRDGAVDVEARLVERLAHQRTKASVL